MKKKQSGSFESKVTKDKSIIIAKWHVNSIVSVASNAEPVHPLHSVSRFSRTQKKIVTVPQPHCIYAYNTGMRGVDRSDQNISLEEMVLSSDCTTILDDAEQNPWQQHKISNGKLGHLSFRRRIALALLETNQRVRGKKA
ncbi:hypothetical protein PR048_032712 [Dryococelus australis]|uniref:PiggyBac transposable element-derived protein domain-containing protein n=1 Tax=Dryococelus australis TaxID=614101 RepID=A0ABQ9G764_9NEOP|nr:hypothetical protein PR048_032712 [Dryococelus australis]